MAEHNVPNGLGVSLGTMAEALAALWLKLNAEGK
jgi:hypothetical protein